MDVDQLTCFLSVAELGSLTAAARRHFITQPAVSQRLRALEARVGMPLLERRRGGVRLTAAGELFRLAARDAVAALERGAAEVAELRGVKRGRLALGAIDAAGIYRLPPLLRRFHRRFPDVELVLRVEPSGPLIAALLAGEIDCAIVTLPVGGAALETIPLEVDPMVLVVPAVERPGVTAGAAFERWKLIAYPRGSTTRGLVDAELVRRGISARTAMELSHPEAMLRLVEAELGAAVLPRRIVRPDGARIRTVRDFRLDRRLGLVARANEAPSPAARAFRDMVASGGRVRASGTV